MKRILLLFAKRSAETGLAAPEDLAKLLNDTKKAHFEYAFFGEITAYLDSKTVLFRNERAGLALDEYDAIYLRFWGLPETQGHALAIARYCSIRGIPFFDKEVLRTGSMNKLTQYINLHEANVPFPATFIAEGSNLPNGITRHNFTYPFILKAAKASRGGQNYLVKSADELARIIAENATIPFIAQEYIENDGDFRIIVMGNDVKLIIKRIATTGSHLNNTSKGGTAQLVDKRQFSEATLKDSVAAATFFGRDIAGVDMVIDNSGQHYCFEVNRAPQIEHSSFETEKAEALADFLADF